MARWTPVDPNLVPNNREAHRGRVSYPLLKSFLEGGLPVAQLDRTGLQQGLQSLNSCLNSYIKGHNLPIKLFQRSGEIYAARKDLDQEGKPNPAYNDIANVPRNQPTRPVDYTPERQEDIQGIDDEEVDRRYGTDRDRITA